ncbi:MAG TPA: helix-turn-helix domain-containing protein [Fervidobacterium sp.]|jgi:hypothetical protein|nr:helix-turn-helix domain-containing protein [Fervidobacterium sp.]
MGQAKEISIRQKIALAHKQGRSYTELANEYGINFNTVRTICLRYEAEGERGLVPRYGNCGRSIKDDDELAFRFVRLVKSLHPLWGISYILGRIRQDYPNLQLQSLRHYQRRVQSKTGKIPKAQVPRITPADTARVAHETWQIDAKECIELGDGSGACYLNISDEKTAAVLKAKVFPPGQDM